VPPEPPTLEALDKATGQLVWKTELPRAPSSPMTYVHRGKQYIAMAAGGGPQAEIIAYALPQ
jgi:quinoprotein glucose dehydrogenase